MSSFFAMMSRMKYIDRWALMRNSMTENISEHSLEVAMLSHALAVIGNRRFGKRLDTGRIVLIALYHDTTEILTGDMPTPVKYGSPELRDAYKTIESQAAERLLQLLPEEFREDFEPLYKPSEEDAYLWQLMKAADKLSALIKCIEEEKTGNREFSLALKSTEEGLLRDSARLPELAVFMEEFLPAYRVTLDEL